MSGTVLLVEDNPDDGFLIKRAFKKAKLANPLFVVEDGEEAVAYLVGEGEFADRSEHPLPMLILLDLKLPKMSGFEVLQWRMGNPGVKKIPVVVLTSSNQTPDIEKAYELGANSYLVKPVSFEGLMEMVRVLGMYWLILNEVAVVGG